MAFGGRRNGRRFHVGGLTSRTWVRHSVPGTGNISSRLSRTYRLRIGERRRRNDYGTLLELEYDNRRNANDQRGAIWKPDFMGPTGRNPVKHHL